MRYLPGQRGVNMQHSFTTEELDALEDFVLCVVRRHVSQELPDTETGRFEKETAEQNLLYARMRLRGE